MDWRIQAYKQLHLEERPKPKNAPEPDLSTCRVISRFGNMVVPPSQEAPKMDDQDLGEWLEGPEQKIEPESHKNGFSILLCGRPERVFDDFSDDAKDGREVRANFSNIPFNKATSGYKSPKEAVRSALKHFQVHTHMGQGVKRRTPYFSVADMVEPEKGKIPFLIRSYTSLMTGTFPAGTEKTVYTATFDTGITNFKENLAFTSTYFHSNETSFGVILGCTSKDIEKATTLLKDCGSSWNHQLLLPAVFLELQRQRLENIRKEFTKKALELQGDFEEIRDHKNGQKRFEFGNRPRTIAYCNKVLSDLCTDSNVMKEDITIALRHLSRLKRHAEELAERRANELAESQTKKPTTSQVEGSKKLKETLEVKTKRLARDNARCFLDLFDEIGDDVERVSGAVTMIRSSLKQDTQWSMGLAFVAMAYLPITALATIFAMPVFDFKASWRDMDNRPANWSESSDSPASASPSSSPPIMSIYFTYWISTSIVLTWLTIEGWWLFSSEVEEWRWDRFWSLRQLAGAIELIIEIPSWVFEKFGEIWTWVVIWVVKCRSFLEDHREKRRKSESPKGVNGESNGGVQSGQTSPVW